ncbi:DUF4129 domain-containing protein [Paenibacillus luteus]|uniref:DUF4129 domain-containing protein n=1 Tax=Paenibacillus luteus TaxID=2545753 RepID=UPI0011414299|nr:DUF4129 domain-containing protein [Paenibacillus luteus]
MNEPTKRSIAWQSFGQGIIELFFYLPVLLIVGVYLLPAASLWVWIATLPLCYWAASLLLQKFLRLRYGIRLLLAVLIGLLHSGIILSITGSGLPVLPLVMCSLVAAITAIKGMSAQTRGWLISFSNTQMLIGVALYIGMQPLKLFLFKALVDYNGILIVCGIASVILLFFFANERHLNSETVDSAKSSATLAFKRQNRLLIIIVVILISVLALFRQIQQMVERFFHSVIDRMMNWLNRPGKEEITEEPPGNPQAPEMPQGEVKPPSEWMLILEQIIKIVGIVLLIAAVVVLMYFIIKKVMKWAMLLAAKLQERGADRANGGDSYTDEIESLMTLTKLRERMGNRLKKLLPRKRTFTQEWNELTTNTEKIRYLYSYFLRTGTEQGYKAKAHMTPRETAADLAKWNDGKLKHEGMQSFIDVYEETRYGEMPPADNVVEALKQQLNKKK